MSVVSPPSCLKCARGGGGNWGECHTFDALLSASAAYGAVHGYGFSTWWQKNNVMYHWLPNQILLRSGSRRIKSGIVSNLAIKAKSNIGQNNHGAHRVTNSVVKSLCKNHHLNTIVPLTMLPYSTENCGLNSFCVWSFYIIIFIGLVKERTIFNKEELEMGVYLYALTRLCEGIKLVISHSQTLGWPLLVTREVTWSGFILQSSYHLHINSSYWIFSCAA